jgi:recombination protein RecT
MTSRTPAPTAADALAKRRENGGVATNSLADQIRGMEKQFQLAMPRGAEATQLVRDALTALRTIKHLDKCEANSVLGALMTCAQLGLRPGVLGHAWPLPFWDRHSKGYKAQLVIGYQG